MILKRERKRFHDFIVLLNNQFFPMSKKSSNNILSLEFSPDEIRTTIDFDSTMRINSSDKGDLPSCKGKIKMTSGILVFIKSKSLGHVDKRLPSEVSEYPWESCSIFFLGKTSMGFFVVIIPQEFFTGSFENRKGRASMSSEHPFLPEIVKTLNGSISPWFSLWNEYHMNAHKQVKANNLRETVRVPSSSCSGHFIIHLGYFGNTHGSPCFNKVFAQGNTLFVSILTCPNGMSCNIHRMKRVKSGDSFLCL